MMSLTKNIRSLDDEFCWRAILLNSEWKCSTIEVVSSHIRTRSSLNSLGTVGPSPGPESGWRVFALLKQLEEDEEKFFMIANVSRLNFSMLYSNLVRVYSESAVIAMIELRGFRISWLTVTFMRAKSSFLASAWSYSTLFEISIIYTRTC